ncbi:MAG: protein-L-isoaspartate(D-aspartate) O-methyltransferase [Kiloniellaceae bacterium]
MAAGWLRSLAWIAAIGLLSAGPGPAGAAEGAGYADKRTRMVEVIQAHARSGYSRALAPGIAAPVLQAMGRVPRHEFVPRNLRNAAYQDRPLPIGYGQTISQPYIVALMTDLLKVDPGDVVLEVGTGSGYQAAVLADLDVQVYTIEIVPELGRQAAARLDRLGYDKARTRVGDGYYGWKEHAPFDGIVVTAAANHIPPPLVRQLRPGGRMVIPVGEPFMVQQLVLVTKKGDGTVQTRQLLPVSFVPLTGGH